MHSKLKDLRHVFILFPGWQPTQPTYDIPSNFLEAYPSTPDNVVSIMGANDVPKIHFLLHFSVIGEHMLRRSLLHFPHTLVKRKVKFHVCTNDADLEWDSLQ